MKNKEYKYYLIFGTRLIRSNKRKFILDFYEEYSLGDWYKMEDQSEVYRRINGIDNSESDDSPYWIGNSSIMDTIEKITEKQANEFIEKYKKAYLDHKTWYFNYMLYDEEKDFLNRTNYAVSLQDLFTPIKDKIMLPIDALHSCLLDDAENGNLDFKAEDFKICDRILYFIQEFDTIYDEIGVVDFKEKLNDLLNNTNN